MQLQTFGQFLAHNARWLVGGALLTMFSSFGQTFFISLSNAGIRADYSLSHGEFGGLYMLATLGSALTLPFIGRLLDRWRAVTVAAGTIAMLATATVLMSLSRSLGTLLLSLYLLRLFGQGMMTQTAFTATGRWFAFNRGRAMSLVSLGMQAGEASLPLLFVVVASRIGWRDSWLVAAGALALVALPLTCLLLRRDRHPASDPVGQVQAPVRQWTLGEVVRQPAFYGLLLGVLAPAFIATSIFFHQVYLAELRGWPLTLFASAFVVMSASTVLFSLLTGWLIDRYSAVAVLPAFLLPLTLACFVLASVSAPWAIFAFMVLMGVSNGFSSTLLGALWPEIYGVQHLGAIRSVIVAATVLSSAAGPGLTGYLIDRGVSFDIQLIGMGVYSLAAAGLMALIAGKLKRSNPAAWRP